MEDHVRLEPPLRQSVWRFVWDDVFESIPMHGRNISEKEKKSHVCGKKKTILKVSFCFEQQMRFLLAWLSVSFCFAYAIANALSSNIYFEEEPNTMWELLQKGMYARFFFPAYISFRHTYRTHVISSGVSMLSGMWSLRYAPTENANAIHQLNGLIYVISSFLRCITILPLIAYSDSLNSHTIYPLFLVAAWDYLSLTFSVLSVAAGEIELYKRWMIRNFNVGAGSIWVRVLAAVWTFLDLRYMKVVDLHQRMNNTLVLVGFLQGILFGEYVLSASGSFEKQASMIGMIVLLGCLLTTI